MKTGDRIVAINGQAIGADFYSSPAGNWNRESAGSVAALRLADGRRLHFQLADYY